MLQVKVVKVIFVGLSKRFPEEEMRWSPGGRGRGGVGEGWGGSGSVVVQALAGLLEVAVAPVCPREAGPGQVLPLKGAAAQPLALRLGPGPLDAPQVDVARQRDAPRAGTPGHEPRARRRPGHKGSR